MKEFNKWFTISFNYFNKDIERTIPINKVEIDGDTWFYYFDVVIKGETYTMEVWGTYDDDGNVRTSGKCVVDGVESLCAFGVNVTDSDGNICGYVDDIDIIDSD